MTQSSSPPTAPPAGPATTDHAEVAARIRRTELLAHADAESLCRLAEVCLQGAEDPLVVHGPELGVVVLQVREPVEEIRFQLAEVLATEVEVVHRDRAGWALRLGDQPEAALAAALLDAEVLADGPAAAAVEKLCDLVERERQRQRAEEWSALAATVVDFEEME